MAATIVQVAGNAATGASVAATFSTAPTAGNIVVAFINSDNVFTVSGSGTRRYTFLSDQQFDIWEYTTTLPTTVTVTPNSADYVAITLVELGGVSGFDLVGGDSQKPGVSGQTTATVPTLTTTAASDIVLACVALHGSTTGAIPNTPVWGNSFTVARTTGQPANGGAPTGQWVGSKVQATAGAVGATTVTWSNGADNTDSVALAYKASATGGSGVSLTAVAAQSTATMPVPVLSVGTVVSGGGPMAATATMPVPTLSVGVNLTAVAAKATASAPIPAVTVGSNTTLAAVAAHATATMPTPGLSVGVHLTAAVATATATMRTPTINLSPIVARNIQILGTSVPVSHWGTNGPTVAWQTGQPATQHPHDTTQPASAWATTSPTN